LDELSPMVVLGKPKLNKSLIILLFALLRKLISLN
jgi:hypothetical protein